MSGRRLRDGASVKGPYARGMPGAALGVAALVAAFATVPTHGSFEQHLLSLADLHPEDAYADPDADGGSLRSGESLLSSLGALFERTRIGVRAESHHYTILRYGTFDDRAFVGAFGMWAQLPWRAGAWDRHRAGVRALGGHMLHRSARALHMCSRGAAEPHAVLTAVLVGVHLAWLMYPRCTQRHCLCSRRALAGGRVHTLITSNLLHLRIYHLAHNALIIHQYAPRLLLSLGCDRFVELLLLACIGSSVASVIWSPRGGGASIGASGIAMATLAAHAAIDPYTATYVYGLDLPAAHTALAYLLLDVALHSGEGVDASAHVGGALCGWALARSRSAGAFGWFARRGAWF